MKHPWGFDWSTSMLPRLLVSLTLVAVLAVCSERDPREDQIRRELLARDIVAVEFDNGGFEALIGRDIICKGVLTMTFNGHYSFSL